MTTFFTLAVSAVTAGLCTELANRARVADPSVLPVPGTAEIAWRSPDGRCALLHWGRAQTPGVSRAGTIWTGAATPDSGLAPVCTRTSVTRVDPVYLAEVPGAVIVADRATWAAWTSSRLNDHDPLHLCALLNPGFPLGSVTPFTRVTAVAPSTTLYLLKGEATRVSGPVSAPARVPAVPDGQRVRPDEAGTVKTGLDALSLVPAGPDGDAGPGGAGTQGGRLTGNGPGGAGDVARALVSAVAPLRDAGEPVQLSLTGGKDSRLIAAALVTAGVPVVARTHGFDDHPDVVVAAEIARRLGIEHVVRTPAAPGQQVDVLGRIRATVLVSDGMLSAFENVGRPDPAASPALTAGGHGGELLRGGYAETAGRPSTAGGLRRVLSPARSAARSAELLRRLTTKHLGLLRRGPAAAYVASLAPWTASLARHPLHALDDFYLVNRAGRWSAAARQAYLLRERLAQPLFDDRVVRAARAMPLADRVSGALSAAVLADLAPALAEVPLAGKPDPARAPFDWRRQYGEPVAAFLRGYILDLGTASGLFDVVSRPATEKLLAPPHTDRATVWALATAACLLSGDYRNAREKAPHLPVT